MLVDIMSRHKIGYQTFCLPGGGGQSFCAFSVAAAGQGGRGDTGDFMEPDCITNNVINTHGTYCKICNNIIPHRRSVYCSKECLYRARLDRKNVKKRLLVRSVKRQCLHCGSFDMFGRIKYCSDRCANRVHYISTREKKKTYPSYCNRKKKKRNLLEKLRERISGRLRRVLKGDRHSINYRNGLISFTEKQLKVHLEKGFKDGMAWDNYGTIWHIDHKIPLAAFNLRSEIDIKRCWALDNLQPLFAIENLRKGSILGRPNQLGLI